VIHYIIKMGRDEIYAFLIFSIAYFLISKQFKKLADNKLGNMLNEYGDIVFGFLYLLGFIYFYNKYVHKLI
jgi:hypothetical protein